MTITHRRNIPREMRRANQLVNTPAHFVCVLETTEGLQVFINRTAAIRYIEKHPDQELEPIDCRVQI